MDKTEMIARAYLESRGHASVVYEPDGNVPPDFLVDGRVAVEVRRLNQHEATPAGPKGIETAYFVLGPLIRRLVSQLGPSRDGESWFVALSFARPLPPWSVLRKALRRTLMAFRDSEARSACEIRLFPQVELRLFRGGPTHSTLFVFGALSDYDAGGWLVSEIIRNTAICVEEKTGKVAVVRGRYSEWWLLLVDYIGHGALDESDYALLRAHLQRPDGWDKLILVDPSRPANGVEM